MRCAYSSNIGIRRKLNQDAYLAVNFEKNGQVWYAFVVADGLGGHPAGEVASEVTVNYIKQNIAGVSDYADYACINNFVNDINQKLLDMGKADPEKTGMATTLTMCLVNGSALSIAHVGDSRAYRISERGMEQLTKDHSLVQVLVDEGRLKSSQARQHPQKNVITRALGTDQQVRTDFFEYQIEYGDYFLVCSDGLYNMVPESEIRDVVLNMSMEEAVKELINRANQYGGSDNITLIVFNQDELQSTSDISDILQ